MVATLNTVSALAVLDLRQELLHFGVLEEDRLSDLGLTDEQLLGEKRHHLPLQELRIDEQALITLWQLADQCQQHSHLGLVIGQRQNPQTKGILANWLFQCDNTLTSTELFIEHMQLMNPSESLQLLQRDSASGDEALIELVFGFEHSKAYPPIAIERSMSGVLHWFEMLTGESITPVSAYFAFPEPKARRAFTDLFGESVVFSQTDNRLIFRREEFSRPIGSRNDYLYDVMAERTQQALRQLVNSNDVLQRAKTIVQQELRQPPTLDQLAQRLNLSRATLYRKLKAQGVNYSELLVDVKKEKAQRDVLAGKPFSVISYDLGFTEVSSFYKAFKRWFGVSPGGFR